MPTVSVIIPAYNAERTILETVQSVQNQTFQDFEIIVIDDGSKDSTLDVLRQIDDSRLRVFSYENAGVSAARNRGLTKASGEFISFIDAADLWTPDKLEFQLEALKKHSSAGVAYSWTINMRDDEGELSFFQGASRNIGGNVFSELLLGNFVGSGSNILVRREAVDSTRLFSENLSTYADWEFYLQLAEKWNFVVVPRNQILYRKTNTSMSAKGDTTEQEGLYTIELVFQKVPPELQKLKNKSIACLYRYCSDLYLRYLNDPKATQLAQDKLWIAIKLCPQLLTEKYTQQLVLKLVLKKLLPNKIVSFISSLSREKFDLPDPRISKN